MYFFFSFALFFMTNVGFSKDSQSQVYKNTLSKIGEVKENQYLTCGCGCCPSSLEKPIEKCIDTKSGETISKVKEKDSAQKASKSCETAGCSQAILYKVCP